MHETVIARKIMADAQRKAGRRQIKSISIDVGDLAPVTPDELKETLLQLSGWRVKVKAARAKVKCKCGFKGKPKILERGHDFCLYVCQRCSAVPTVAEGRDIIIREVGF